MYFSNGPPYAERVHQVNFIVRFIIRVEFPHVMISWSFCEGCDIVQSDHAPQAGVAQGIFNGDLIRRRVGRKVELEEELDEEVERRVRRDHSRSKTQVRMHG